MIVEWKTQLVFQKKKALFAYITKMSISETKFILTLGFTKNKDNLYFKYLKSSESFHFWLISSLNYTSLISSVFHRSVISSRHYHPIKIFLDTLILVSTTEHYALHTFFQYCSDCFLCIFCFVIQRVIINWTGTPFLYEAIQEGNNIFLKSYKNIEPIIYSLVYLNFLYVIHNIINHGYLIVDICGFKVYWFLLNFIIKFFKIS